MKAKTLHSKDLFSERAEEIFCTALEIKGMVERDAYVERACGRDLVLRVRVRELLAAQDDVERFFNDSSPALVSSGVSTQHPDDGTSRGENGSAEATMEEKPGEHIGPYKLLQVIGEGGCGVVYMAEQEKPVHRRVALKVIKLGMDTKSVITRFQAEQQALALMDHPNIAHVLDAGATEAGRPYFVMELVRGVKLTAYCDQNQLNTRLRLNLFIQVCHAIQHAHQKGIIHRDIKPSNILVTMHDGVPIPTVIDFGIAKAIEGRLTDQTLFTPHEQFIGTPAYMSPEQAEMSQMDVDTRSDIYSLGVLLYELLTGRTPFDKTQLLQSGLDEMRRTLRERDPLRPSTIITTLEGEQLSHIAHSHHAEPAKLVSLLRGDLDWIVMKALEKDRDRRYQTANALAMEVQRYLNNEPILARPPSQFYRLHKLIRRNKIVFASGAALAAALAVGLCVSTGLLIRARAAEREEARLRKVAEKGFATEAELHQQAEAREKIIRAAMLLSEGAYANADQLIAQLPLEQSTMEGADVFETLGEWNAINERWQAAKNRFHLLRHARRVDSPINASLDWTKEAVAIIEINDRAEYDRFCEDSINTFATTKDPIVAGRIVRNCLLVPASPTLIDPLRPLALCVQKTWEGTNFSADTASWQVPWRCEVLALWEYRTGNFFDSIVWSRRCLLGGDQPPVRAAGARLILAMSLRRLGKTTEARSEFQQANTMIKAKFAEPQALTNSSDGAWFDWVISRIWLREATALINGSQEDSVDDGTPSISD